MLATTKSSLQKKRTYLAIILDQELLTKAVVKDACSCCRLATGADLGFLEGGFY